jgi:two-component system, response regulator, stage 0 sporulation protein F
MALAARRKVLIVDDAGPVIILCVNVLQSLGYAVRGVNRGEAALDALRLEKYDLMLVDYKMPGMNGLQVFEAARGLQPDLRCMLVTGHGTPDIIDQATRAGFGSILLKPFSSTELKVGVEKALAGS